MESSHVITLVAVTLGWGLNAIATYCRERRERRQRLYELRIDAYARWMSGMESVMQSWTSPDIVATHADMNVLLKKLELLEPDADIVRLLKEIPETLPRTGSQAYHFMGMAATTDETFDYAPFRAKMDALTAVVREAQPK